MKLGGNCSGKFQELMIDTQEFNIVENSKYK